MNKMDQDASISTSELTYRLLRKYETSEDAVTSKYIAATQVRASGSYTDRTADAIIIGNWPSAGYEIQGFEIKISRADWLNELKSPTKSEAVKRYCDKWWLLIASETFVKEGELPEDWGMMAPHGTGLRIVKAAPTLTPEPISVEFITGLMRANKREHISMDLHAQYIQDSRREIEAKLKKEYAGLKQFAKFIHEAFGIELKQDERWVREDYGIAKKEKYWVAKVRNGYKTYTAEQLKTMLEAVISGDFDQVAKDLAAAHNKAAGALELLDKYKGTRLW